jgi:hypothetical protein
MKVFKGFEDFVEIFRGGKQLDSAGKEHDGDDLIDKAVASFNAAHHEPPVVAGHPKDNGPAYGWTKELKAEVIDGTKVLLAKFGDVMPEFEELVRAGRYKKRSASFYPDGSLRHVGFLGAVPPAVKGLADIKFDEGEPVTFDFYDYRAGVIARLFGRIREFLIEEKGVEAADRIVPDWDVDTLKEEASRQEEAVGSIAAYSESEEGTMFTEADIEAAKIKGREEAAAEFAENEATQKKAAAKEQIAAFCKKPVAEGGPLPAWIDGGLQEFMEGLVDSAPIEFAEGKSQSGLEWFNGFLEKLPATVEFKEIAGRDKDVPTEQSAVEIARQATEFRDAEAKAGRSINFTQAVAHVTKGG